MQSVSELLEKVQNYKNNIFSIEDRSKNDTKESLDIYINISIKIKA